MAIKRSLLAIYLDTTPSSTATYVLEGKGVDEMGIDMSPKTESYTDVTQDTATTDLVGYEPKSTGKKRVDKSDAAFTYLNTLRRNRSVGADAITNIVIVDLWETPTAGAYPAEKQSVTVSVSSWGGSGGDNLTLEYEYGFRGDATKGTFNPTTKTFTAS
jgi:hypothetical protein